jgi:hypothetical protein
MKRRSYSIGGTSAIESYVSQQAELFFYPQIFLIDL